MNLFDAIHGRRSVRLYAVRDVEAASLKQILEAGMAAPSAGDERPWHFVVIRKKETLKALSGPHLFAAMVQQAPLAILVCADTTRVKHADFWPLDCAAAVQNMLLATHAVGLGTVWVGLYPQERRMAHVRSVIHLPDTVVPFCLLPVGHRGEEKPPENRFDRARIHEEGW